MIFPQDFPQVKGEFIGIMSVDSSTLELFVETWAGERLVIDGADTWPLDGAQWGDMLKRNGLKIKRLKRQTNVVRI